MKRMFLSEEHKRKIGDANKKAHPKTLYDYVCVQCGIAFQSRQKNRLFCSQICYHSSLIFNHKCLFCGESFKSNIHNSQYCNKCKIKKCEICGNEFELSASELKGTNHNAPKKYCSVECYHKSTLGKTPPNKKEGINIVCKTCGKTFNVWKSRTKRDVKYCSRKCKHDAQSKVTGINHPLWKGGYDLYSRLLSENEGSFYRNRRIVLERDNNTCQYCGDQRESKQMDVHHIIPVIKNGTNQIDNMITLCRKCHNHADRKMIQIPLLKEKVVI